MGETAIGLVGGLAVNAGVLYYEELARRFAAEGRTLHLVLAHADVRTVLPFVASGDANGLARYLSDVVARLHGAGCSAAAITAIAPHVCIEDLQGLVSIPLIDVLSVLRSFARSELRQERVAIFGNGAVVRTNVYGALDGERVVRPPDATIERIHDIYNSIAMLGKRGTETEYRALEEIAAELATMGAEAIVLAGTDLASFYKERPPKFPFIDVAGLHIDAIARSWNAASSARS